MERVNGSGCGRDSGRDSGDSTSSSRKEVTGGGGKEEERRRQADGRIGAEGTLCVPVKVMTDEQIEVLRQQIAIYATISEQLIQMHKTLSAQQETFTRMRNGGLHTAGSVITPGGFKMIPRQRWTPTAMHLHILESIFKQGHGTPSKQKIKDIALELSQHGQISETNVYNWFQNRRARSKRKQGTATAAPLSNAISEVEVDDEFPSNDQKFNQQVEDEGFPPLINYAMHSPDGEHDQVQNLYQPSYGPRSSGDSGRVSYFDNILPNHTMEQFSGGMDISGSFSPFHSEGFDVMD